MSQIKPTGSSGAVQAIQASQVADPSKYADAAKQAFAALKLALTTRDFAAFKAVFHSEVASLPEGEQIVRAMFDAAPKGGQAQLMTMGALQKGDTDHYFAEIRGAQPGTLVAFAPEANDKLGAVFFGVFRF